MMYGATTDKRRIKNAIAVLDYIYKQIPDTKGCMENINKPEAEGGCGAWCCQVQNPSVLYVEFLNTWNHVTSNWSDEQVGNLIRACLRNYLFERQTKGCVFFDHESKMCSQHGSRPYNCRVYGIIPDEEFKPRYERLRVLNNEVRDQCSLVETANGETVTVKDTNSWWKEVKQQERAIGIDEALITDEPEGSYRTYHDHILIHLFGVEHLEKLSAVRVHMEDSDKESLIDSMMMAYEQVVEKARNADVESQDN
jgi:Fe-S-cluster containining protein